MITRRDFIKQAGTFAVLPCLPPVNWTERPNGKLFLIGSKESYDWETDLCLIKNLPKHIRSTRLKTLTSYDGCTVHLEITDEWGECKYYGHFLEIPPGKILDIEVHPYSCAFQAKLAEVVHLNKFALLIPLSSSGYDINIIKSDNPLAAWPNRHYPHRETKLLYQVRIGHRIITTGHKEPSTYEQILNKGELP